MLPSAINDGHLQDECRLPNDCLDEITKQYAGSETTIKALDDYRPIYEILDKHLDVTLLNPGTGYNPSYSARFGLLGSPPSS